MRYDVACTHPLEMLEPALERVNTTDVKWQTYDECLLSFVLVYAVGMLGVRCDHCQWLAWNFSSCASWQHLMIPYFFSLLVILSDMRAQLTCSRLRVDGLCSVSQHRKEAPN